MMIKKDYTTSSIKSVKQIFREQEKREKQFWYGNYMKLYRLFWRLVHLPGELKLDIMSFFQRGKRGWSNRDSWSFNYYLSKVISKGVKHLKKINYALPAYEEGMTELEAINKWDVIVNTIINTFEIAKSISEGKILYIPSKNWTEKVYKSMKNDFKFKTLNLKETKEFEKGFDLFKEWFFALRD